MKQQIFEFLGRRIELWTHPEPDHMGRSIRAGRTFYEADVLLRCRERHLPGTAIIDAGANIGNHTVFFGLILNASVYAFEPLPSNFDLLEMNIAANGLDGQVVATCCALGQADGLGELHSGPPSNLGTTRVSFGLGEVPVRRLDSLALAGPVGLLKLDVEGGEGAVLLGAAALIEAWLPDIVVEAGDARAFQVVAEILLDFGYVPHGRHAATPTYLFIATDQARRVRRILAATRKAATTA